MADINPNIAMGYQPVQLQDPVNQFSKNQELKLGQAKMQEYQRGLEEQNALRDLIKSGVDLKSPEARVKMYSISPELGIKFEKSQAELEKAGYEAKKLKGDVAEQDLKMHLQRVGDLAFNPSNENVLAHLQDAVLRGNLTNDQAKAQWAQVGGMSADQRKQYFTQMGVNAEKRLTDITTRRGQDLTYAAATQPVFSEATGGFVTRPDAQGNVKVIPIANPEETKKGKETSVAKGNVGDIAQTMATSYTKLRDMGAMKSVESGAGSNLAAGTQSSAVGQFLGGVFGTEAQAERDFVKSQRPLLVQAIVKATGMTASQINSNAELKNLLDAATDPAKGYETNIRTLNELNKRYGTGTPINIALPKDQNAPSTPAASTDKAPTKANAAKLLPPVNAQGWTLHVDKNGNRAYVGPNGQIQEVK